MPMTFAQATSTTIPTASIRPAAATFTGPPTCGGSRTSFVSVSDGRWFSFDSG